MSFVWDRDESKQFKLFHLKYLDKLEKDKEGRLTEKNSLILKTLPFRVSFPDPREIYEQTKQMRLKFYVTMEDILNFENSLKFFLAFMQRQNFNKLKKIKKFQKDLPIAHFKDQILYLLDTHPVIIIAGDTGCGKSTQVPQFLLHSGFNHIACTQPRRIACISLAKRVSFETLNEFGNQVAYHVRFDTNKMPETKILFLTEGLLMRQFQVDPQLSQYSVIIVDEVHERHLNSDFLLGVLKCLLKQRQDLKIILMSATINSSLFSSYFDGAPLIQVPGRLHPIVLEYIPDFVKKDIIIKKTSNQFDPSSYVKVLEMIDQKFPAKEGGDLLIFLNGVREISMVVDEAVKYATNNKKWIVLPLHSNLSLEEQDKVFDYAPDGVRKCIVSTNIAETSLTIDGIRFVCDSGKVNEMVYNPAIKLRKLVEMWISKSSAEQRKGRAGRTGPGICYRMYSEQDFADFDEFPVPEIKRADLNSLVLQMLSLGLNDVESFPFIESPEVSGITCAIKDLKIRNAISENNEITFLGKAMASLPLEPSVGAILLYGSFLDMVNQTLVYVAALGIQSPFNSSFRGRADFKDKHLGDVSENFILNCEGDSFQVIRAFGAWLTLKRSEKARFSVIWCRKLGIIERRFYDMVQLCNQFKQLLKSLNISSEEQAQIRLSKNEVKELKSIKEKLQNLPRKRKTLDANFNFVDEEFDFQEMDVKEVEFRLAKSGSILGDLDTEMELDDSILFSLGVALGLYPQFAIPDEANPHRKDSEQFFHTKDKQYLSMHPNSFLGQNPDRLREKLPCGRQPWMLVYVGLLETIKPYLLNCTRIAAIPTLLLTSHLDTDSRCSRIVADGWLEINFTNSSDSLGLLCSAISIRNSFYELLEFYFSQNAELDQEQKMDLLLQFRRQIVDFFHRDIDCTLKYIVNADRQLMYRKQAGDISEIPADLLVTIRYESEETKADTRKGGISLTPYITYGCLIDKSKDFIDQPYLKSHFRCPTCDIHMICTPGEQIAHSNACKPTIEIVEKEKDENDEKMHMEDNKPDKIRYNCQICNQELFLTTTEILRHRQTH